MVNHRRNKAQRHWAGEQLAVARKQAQRRNAIPATKQAQRELAAEAVAEHPITRINAAANAANSHRIRAH